MELTHDIAVYCKHDDEILITNRHTLKAFIRSSVIDGLTRLLYPPDANV